MVFLLFVILGTLIALAQGQCSCDCPTKTACPTNCAACSVVSTSCICTTDCSTNPLCDSGYVSSSPYLGVCDSTLSESQRDCKWTGCTQTGSCTSCASGYYGSSCTACPECDSPHYCRDTMSGDGSCVCPTGYLGDSCQYSNAGTCNSHGTVSSSGVCTCTTAFTGTNCEKCNTNYYNYPTCTYCLASSDCTGHGVCASGGGCSCFTNYTGSKCSSCKQDYYNYPTCFYCLSSSATQGCSGHGSCTSSGCSCNTGWTTSNCGQCASGYGGSTCSACPGGATNMCNGHGDCDQGITGTGKCTCDSGYNGPACQYSDAGTCNGHGTATYSGGCNCKTGWTGTYCNSCATNYYGPSCLYCLAATTCNGEGTCSTSTAKCVCSTGNDPATNCSTCTANYYGWPNCKYCVNSTTCSGHGYCQTSTGNCICYGLNSGTNCNVCPAGYATENCIACVNGAADPCHTNEGGGTCNSGYSGNGQCACNSPHRGTACDDPTITGGNYTLIPSQGGVNITITGVDFGITGTVSITGSTTLSCPLRSYSSTKIVCTVSPQNPGPGGVGSLFITRGGDSVVSNTVAYSFESPKITLVNPVTGAGPGAGFDVTLTGTSFGNNQATGNTKFGSTTLTIVSWDHLKIVATIPSGIGSGNLSVTQQTKTSTGWPYRYAAPNITGFNPMSLATSGGLLNVQGLNFGPVTATAPIVYIGTGQCNVTSYLSSRIDSNIQCMMTQGQGDQIAIVSVGGQNSSSVTYRFQGPTITNVTGCTNAADNKTTSLCIVGGTITITGNNFGFQLARWGSPSSGALTVTVNGLTCNNLTMKVLHTVLTCTLPVTYGQNVPVVVTRDSAFFQANSVSYAGPVIYPMTTSRLGVPPNITGNISVTNGTNTANDTVTFSGKYFGASKTAITVYFGPVEKSQKYTCTILTINDTNITCKIPPGVGCCHHFQIKVLSTGALSPIGTDVFSYPAPTLNDSSVRLNNPANPGSNASKSVASQGDLVIFDGNFFGIDATEIYIALVQGGVDSGLTCFVDSSTNTRIQCRTGPGGNFQPYQFQVTVGVLQKSAAQTVTSLFTYSAAGAPVISSVTGCTPAANTSMTMNCPTSGLDGQGKPVVITITGDPLGNVTENSVTVGTGDCLNLKNVTGMEGKQVTCNLPPGAGINQLVVIFRLNTFSIPVPFLSYAAPSVYRVSGCTDQGNVTVECPRTSNSSLTIYGQNFGSSMASVLVGGQSCYNLMHDKNSPQTIVYCNLTGGTQLLSSLILIQNQGLSSDGLIYVSFVQCGPGYYAAEGDQICHPCQPGTYNAISSQQNCPACPEGTFQTRQNATACDACASGYYADEPGASNCTECESGYYASSTGYVRCFPCSAGLYANLPGTIDCDQCPPGSFQSISGQSSCQACERGYYSAFLGQGGCQNCSVGTYAPTTGLSGCSSCFSGSIASFQGQSRCDLCVPGKFAGQGHQSSCSNCSSGSSASNYGQDSCVACAPGYAAENDGAISCDPCVPGKFSSTQGSIVCSQCPTGFFSATNLSTGCTQCQPGTSQPAAGTSSCVNCTAGNSMPSYAQALCQPCNVGLYSNVSGLSNCIECPPGTYSEFLTGSVRCVDCASGFYANLPGQPRCFPCVVGKTSSEGASVCSLCTDGTYNNIAGSANCSLCTSGSYSVKGSSQCAPCPFGRASFTDGAASCPGCAPGTYQSGSGQSVCSECQTAKYTSVPGTQTCSSCPGGTFANVSGLSQCLSCTAGFYSTSGLSTCLPCPAGTFALGVSTAKCTPCDVGYYSGSGQSLCDPCPPGTYAPILGLSTCSNCSYGTASVSNAQSACFACDKGTYADHMGQTACGICNIGSIANVTGSSTCYECQPGRYNSFPRQADCTVCQIGRYQNYTNSTSCDQCLKGKYQNAPEGTQCYECAIGYYTPVPGSDRCKACEAGRYANVTGLTACFACPPGQYANQVGNSYCLECELGRYAPPSTSGAPVCDPCLEGTFTNQTGMSLCLSCDAGLFQTSSGQSNCIPCLMGFYTEFPGEDKCAPCGLGQYGPNNGSDLCLDCKPGYFQNATASTSCSPCTPGFFSSADNQAQCFPCKAGDYQANYSQSECTPCAAGTYQSRTGQVGCIPCKPGYQSPQQGASLCEYCQPGYYTNDTQTVNCYACSPGLAQPKSQALDCEFCTPGKFTPSAGLSNCQLTSPGTYQPNSGQNTSLDCPLGHFQEIVGQTDCLTCIPGKYAPTLGTSTCVDCQPGTYLNVTGGSACVECPGGTYQNNPGSSTCAITPPGKFSRVRALTFEDCPVYQISPYQGSSVCMQCQPPSINSLDHLDCICPVGTYNNVTSNRVNISCPNCPTGIKCDGTGVEITALYTLPGYWRANGDTLVYYKCQVPIGCLGGLNSTCAPHRIGPTCSICESGYKETAAYICQKCPEKDLKSWIEFVLVVLFLFTLIVIVGYGVLRIDRDLIVGLTRMQIDSIRNNPNAGASDQKLGTSSTSWRTSSATMSRTNRPLSISTSNIVPPITGLITPLKTPRVPVTPGHNSMAQLPPDIPTDTLANFEDEDMDEAFKNEKNFSKRKESTEKEPDIFSVAYRHRKGNLTHQMKILVSFFQIVTQLAFVLNVPWPSGYRAFLTFFKTVINLDFLGWSGASCLVPNENWYLTYTVTMLIPPALMIAGGVIFCFPGFLYIQVQSEPSTVKNIRMQELMTKWTKLCVFTLFLFFPRLAASSMQLFVCVKVENAWYLQADYRIACYDDQWLMYSRYNILAILIYTCGIPLLFAYMLWRNARARGMDPRVRYFMGFLYEQYTMHMWWFELVDMIHKITLTALLPFLTPNLQIPVGMFVVSSFTILILLGRPYERAPDDLLHLLAQADLFLFLLGGLLFSQGLTYTALSDTIMSVFLILITIGFLFVFFRQLVKVIKKVLRTFIRDSKRLFGKEAVDNRIEQEPEDLHSPRTPHPHLVDDPVAELNSSLEDPQSTNSLSRSGHGIEGLTPLGTSPASSTNGAARTTVTSDFSSARSGAHTVDHSQQSYLSSIPEQSQRSHTTTVTSKTHGGGSPEHSQRTLPPSHQHNSSFAPPAPPPINFSADQLTGLRNLPRPTLGEDYNYVA